MTRWYNDRLRCLTAAIAHGPRSPIRDQGMAPHLYGSGPVNGVDLADFLLQRSMDSVGGPDAKKARWSPTSFGSNGLNGLGNNNARDAFANYGYGPQANLSQQSYSNSSPSNGFSGSPLYATPSLSINTATGNNGIASQMSPNTAGPFSAQPQQTPASANGGASYGGFGGYNMLAMGMPGMGVLNGFAYGNQMGNFSQVSTCLLSC